MVVDEKLVVRKINLILQDLKRLKSISLLAWEDYQKKIDYEILAERYLEIIIGRVIDINFHLIVESGYPPPQNYFASFTELAELKILDADFAK